MRPTSVRTLFVALLAAVTVAVAVPLVAQAKIGKPHVAALQAALWERGHYHGTIDGLTGPLTRAALLSFQAEAGLQQTGKAGANTVAALGGPARRLQGGSVAKRGDQGWDVVRLQFLLAWHGFPSGVFDGVFGERVERATSRFQDWAGVPADGVAGPATFKALRKAPARPRTKLSMPIAAGIGDHFGPRGNRFHAGIDLPADAGTPVAAVKAGTVVFAAYDDGGFGNLVVIQHRYGLTTRYAHLSEFAVVEGARVRRGETIGLVGSTGRSTGPHLHLEIAFRGALINPAPLF
ncbi:MAG: peptidoglycan DD-metalloendopeptidase family protein, partial [Gaiellaceae bacterium]